MVENLSPREREIFDLLLKGVSPKEIAYNLNLKPSTLDYYRTKLYNNLGIHSIQELLVKYSTNGKEATPEPQAKPVAETSAEKSEIITVSKTKKHKIFRLLLPVGLVFIAFSVLLLWIINPSGKPSTHSTPKGVKIPVTDLGFFPTSNLASGGNSTSEMLITREEIDGVTVDVLNININLVKRENSDDNYANVHTNKPDLIQRLRQVNGIRFKARGDGKPWSVDFFTKESTAEGNYPHYEYIVNTVRDQIIVVDVPYSSLYLPDWFKQYSFDFNKETITGMSITANLQHGYGTSLLQIFDFEIY